ncbi:MAG: hypothetical protein CL489_03480 [Acidobacteria bacterium]|nr:hypothetical protein [Acidobacteriota bacterium]
MTKLYNEKKTAREFQERKHNNWEEIYELYRNKVRTNRLTQRQAVNIPLMKETIKTLLSKIDDAPTVDWKELGGDQQKEIFLQELWNSDYERLNFEGVDILDKKTVLKYGRGFKKLNWVGDSVDVRALDVYDIVVDPMVDPLDIETARYAIHQNIFRPLRDILADDRYTRKGRDELKEWSFGEKGIVQSSRNREEWEKKMERLRAMGVDSSEFQHFAGGDVIVNLKEHYTRIWNRKKKAFEKRVIIYANDSTALLNMTMKEAIGVDFYPFVTWGEDVETEDFWSDGPADLVRVPNKVVNVWFSQLVENRTLKNFQMHWYDATKQGYSPQTYEPGAGRMLPAPGNPRDTISPVDVSGLDDTLTSIDFLIRLIERGTAATAIDKGVGEKKQITLGEVKLLVGKAMERTQAMSKFYRRSWYELATKWYNLMNTNLKGKRTLFKMSRNGLLVPKVIYHSDWKSKRGYKPMVRSSSEQEEENLQGIQKFMMVKGQFPNNIALNKIAQKRMLEILDLTPEEIREVEEENKNMAEQAEEAQLMQQAQQQQAQQQPGAVPAPPQPQDNSALAGQVQNKMSELENLNQ